MSAVVRKRIDDRSVAATKAAHDATASVVGAMATEMRRLGFVDGGEFDEDRELYRSIWLKLLRRIDMKRDPRVSVVTAAITRGPEPTRAQALIASGLLDMAAGIEDLSATLATAVTNDLAGFVHESVVHGAIKRAIVDLFNAQAHHEQQS